MNYLQRAWLWALRPVTGFVNEKLAKRSGLLGKLGRFFAIGPREFGYHPTSKMLAYTNRVLLQGMGFMLHRYSGLKSATGNGYQMMRPFRTVAFMPAFLALLPFIFIANSSGFFEQEEGTSLDWLMNKQPMGVPINALNHRVSAHFSEINSIYGVEMMKKYSKVLEDLVSEYNNASMQDRRTRYTREGYEYIPISSAPDGK